MPVIISPVARSVPFDNTSNGFPAAADNVQTAIEYALQFDPQTISGIQFDDFNNLVTWSPSTLGIGSVASVSTGNATLASGKHLGVAELVVGGILGAHASLVQSAGLSTSTVFGNGAAEYKSLIHIPALATVTNDYVFRCGLGTSANADHANGIYFEYNRSQSTNWRLKTASNSTRTVNTSSIAVVAGSWIQLRWGVNSAGTQVDFYINGVLAGSNTTNIPTETGQGCGPNFQMTRTAVLAGTLNIYLDYFYFLKTFTARD